ncbi:MAG TPA: transposase [Blastocatellia bacterium]|nr:transposase [Blastocatellia bacterium]
MSLKAQSGGHSKHALAVHIVWCVKYRRTVLTREVGDRLKEIVTDIATAKGCEILSIETDSARALSGCPGSGVSIPLREGGASFSQLR